jgi:hypothetical protein
MADTYGGRNVENRFSIPTLGGDNKDFYTLLDTSTGSYEVKRVQPGGGIFGDAEVGTFDTEGNFTPGKDFKSVLDKAGQKKFLSEETRKILNTQATETGVRSQIELGVPEKTARLRTEELLKKGEATTDPNQSNEESAAQSAAEGLDDLKKDLNEIANSEFAEAASGTRKGSGSFGNFSYPKGRNQSQDFMKFTLLEYKPKTIGSGADGGGFGFGDRVRKGPNGESGDRTILGSCSLPIPGGIKDENGCDWQGDTMNELQIQGAAIARSVLGQGDKDPGQAGEALAARIGGNSEDLKKAIANVFAGKAVGVQRLMSRTTGMIFNPNLELLFDKPTLRGFQFSFDLTPRSKEEADEVIKIIKFFKQGMSPIRSESNLFLLSPHVFQVHYVLNGDGNQDHPFIGKMKECAMTNFAVDYTPQQNYSTLTDGYMTAYKISMQMKELEPVFNDDYGTGDEIEIGF